MGLGWFLFSPFYFFEAPILFSFLFYNQGKKYRIKKNNFPSNSNAMWFCKIRDWPTVRIRKEQLSYWRRQEGTLWGGEKGEKQSGQLLGGEFPIPFFPHQEKRTDFCEPNWPVNPHRLPVDSKNPLWWKMRINHQANASCWVLRKMYRPWPQLSSER